MILFSFFHFMNCNNSYGNQPGVYGNNMRPSPTSCSMKSRINNNTNPSYVQNVVVPPYPVQNVVIPPYPVQSMVMPPPVKYVSSPIPTISSNISSECSMRSEMPELPKPAEYNSQPSNNSPPLQFTTLPPKSPNDNIQSVVYRPDEPEKQKTVITVESPAPSPSVNNPTPFVCDDQKPNIFVVQPPKNAPYTNNNTNYSPPVVQQPTASNVVYVEAPPKIVPVNNTIPQIVCEEPTPNQVQPNAVTYTNTPPTQYVPVSPPIQPTTSNVVYVESPPKVVPVNNTIPQIAFDEPVLKQNVVYVDAPPRIPRSITFPQAPLTQNSNPNPNIVAPTVYYNPPQIQNDCYTYQTQEMPPVNVVPLNTNVRYQPSCEIVSHQSGTNQVRPDPLQTQLNQIVKNVLLQNTPVSSQVKPKPKYETCEYVLQQSVPVQQNSNQNLNLNSAPANEVEKMYDECNVGKPNNSNLKDLESQIVPETIKYKDNNPNSPIRMGFTNVDVEYVDKNADKCVPCSEK